MHYSLIAAVAAEHQADLLRAADRHRLARAAAAGHGRRGPGLLGRTHRRITSVNTALRQHLLPTPAARCCA